MPFNLIVPQPPPEWSGLCDDDDNHSLSEISDSSDGGANIGAVQGLSSHKIAKRAKRASDTHQTVVTPGEVVTDDPKWMRGHGTYLKPDTTAIVSSVAGMVARTNRLLSVRPLRARYQPEVGDLVVGRIIEVQAKRWQVDIGSTQMAGLPLSAINLPGGILRKRTETDELQMRTFFSEGDVLVAEVQQVYQDGGAVLHTRSLKYGKLRNGIFMTVSGAGGGGGGGVVRSRRQVWTADAACHGSKIDVILGVNGYIWICKHVDAPEGAEKAGITNMEDVVSETMYSSQNDAIEAETMREITRMRGVITVLVDHGLPVNEEMVMKGYHEATELALASDTGLDDVYLGEAPGQTLAATLKGHGTRSPA